MKHSFLARFWVFLENHLAAILALFIPVWLGLLFVGAVVLRGLEAANLLPSEISHAILIGTPQRSFRPGLFRHAGIRLSSGRNRVPHVDKLTSDPVGGTRNPGCLFMVLTYNLCAH